MKMYVYNGKNKQYIVNMQYTDKNNCSKLSYLKWLEQFLEYQNSSEERRGDEVCKC